VTSSLPIAVDGGPDPIPRMRASARRELILAAATSVFADRGYVGATTDQVAKAAGVSQPYVVRMFGTKENLFLEVLQRDLDRLLVVFRAAIADPTESMSLEHRLGLAYVSLLDDDGLLLSLMHGFVLGRDARIGAAARAGFMTVYGMLRHEAGMDAQQASTFLANGMLLNTLIGTRMADDYSTSADVRELLETAMPTKLDVLLNMSKRSR
jgi:AcrR family transcriptional regulator